MSIFETLRAHNVELTSKKDWTYFRDVSWPNLRRYSIDKRDRINKTGEGGGTKAKLTEVDELVLDIIGRDSAVVHGLLVEETWQEEAEVDGDDSEKENSSFVRAAVSSKKAVTTTYVAKADKKKMDDFVTEFRKKKLRKMDLEIQNLELRNEILRRHLSSGSTIHETPHLDMLFSTDIPTHL